MQFHKNIVKLAYFTFKIKNIIFVKSIILNILLKSHIFYIIFINIPFLLYLDKINKLGYFLIILLIK